MRHEPASQAQHRPVVIQANQIQRVLTGVDANGADNYCDMAMCSA